MNEEERSSREQLLAEQAQDPKLKLTYQEEIRAMLERRIPAPVRWMLATYAVLLLLVAVVTAGALARMTADDPGLELCVPGLVFALAMAGGLAWIAWRGTPLRAIHGLFGALMMGCFSMVAAGYLNDNLLTLAPGDMRARVGWIPAAVLILGWLPMVLVVNSHYHERTREKLLEIQYQIAELAEEVRKRK
jgi:peptidoglycan/LPS O-acetylase OafA/YrhL